jgi:citrate lyase beta subunit
MAAAIIGADAIDAVFVDLKSPDLLRKDAMRARALGFRGKTAVHPIRLPSSMRCSRRRPTTCQSTTHRRSRRRRPNRRARAPSASKTAMVDAPIVLRAKG